MYTLLCTGTHKIYASSHIRALHWKSHYPIKGKEQPKPKMKGKDCTPWGTEVFRLKKPLRHKPIFVRPHIGLYPAFFSYELCEFTKGFRLQILRMLKTSSKPWPGLSYSGSYYRAENSSMIMKDTNQMPNPDHCFHHANRRKRICLGSECGLNPTAEELRVLWDITWFYYKFPFIWITSGFSKCFNINKCQYLGRKIEDERKISYLCTPNAERPKV